MCLTNVLFLFLLTRVFFVNLQLGILQLPSDMRPGLNPSPWWLGEGGAKFLAPMLKKLIMVNTVVWCGWLWGNEARMVISTISLSWTSYIIILLLIMILLIVIIDLSINVIIFIRPLSDSFFSTIFTFSQASILLMSLRIQWLRWSWKIGRSTSRRFRRGMQPPMFWGEAGGTFGNKNHKDGIRLM